MQLHHPPFQDRRDAGRQLAAALQHLQHAHPVVLALPRGGVPVGYEIARALHAPLDVLLVRKLGSPGHPEVGLGAIAEGEQHRRVLNKSMLLDLQPSDVYLAAEEQRQIEEIGRRRTLYSQARVPVDIRGRTVIVVDDGIANGGTMKAALEAVADGAPARLIFAVPVAPRETLPVLGEAADEGVCLLAPANFRAVSLYYADFAQTTDDEVIDLLTKSHANEQEKLMQTISDVMTRDITIISPQDNVQRAAQMMREWDVGVLPVHDGQRLVGMITDRDITIRAIPTGQSPDQIKVADVMTDEVLWCYEDQTVGAVLQQMGDEQIRRIPVVDRDMQLVGIVSLGDIAARHAADTDDTLEEISKPSEPVRQSADAIRLHRPQSDQADGLF